jgi:hypothetical protein
MKAADCAAGGGQIVYPKRELVVAPSITQVEDFLGTQGPCWNSPLLSVDIETGWGMIRGVAFAPSPEQAMYVPFISLGKPDRNYWRTLDDELRAWTAIKTVLEHEVPKLGQNFGNYDLTWLLQKAGIKVRNYGDDLRLCHKALYPELPADLEFMGSAYSEQGSWKVWAQHGGTKEVTGDKRDG